MSAAIDPTDERLFHDPDSRGRRLRPGAALLQRPRVVEALRRDYLAPADQDNRNVHCYACDRPPSQWMVPYVGPTCDACVKAAQGLLADLDATALAG